MNSLEAFEAYFGVAPSDYHINQAMHADKGGLDDARTANSFAAQVATLQEVIMEVYPTMLFAPTQLLSVVQLWAFEHIIARPDAQWVLSNVLTASQRAPLDAATFLQKPQKSLVELMYEDILGRASDPQGFAHYRDMIDAGEDPFVVIRHIYLSPEGSARREAQVNNNG